MRAAMLGAVVACAMGTGASAATYAGASSSVGIFWSVGEGYSESQIEALGSGSLDASVGASGANDQSYRTFSSTFTLTNVSVASVELFIGASATGGATVLIGEGFSDGDFGPLGTTVGQAGAFAGFEPNELFLNGFGSGPFAVAERTCASLDSSQCEFGYGESQSSDYLDPVSFFLEAGDSLAFNLFGSASASIVTTPLIDEPSPVPLPATAGLLIAGLAGLGLARRRV